MNLIIYDFDNTLVRTESHIIVKYMDGSIERVPSHLFHLEAHSNDKEYDFSEFEDVCHKTSIVLESIENLYSDLSKYYRHPDYYICLLTARKNPDPIRDFLMRMGIRVFFPIHAVEGSENKLFWIKDFISENDVELITLYDDDLSLIESVRNIAERRFVKFSGILIK